MLNVQYENYEEALIYLEKLIKNNDMPVILIKQYQIYIKNKLNQIDSSEHIDGYFNNQMIKYNHRTAIEHIKYHLDENNEKELHSKFFSEIDINNLFDLINSKIGGYKKQNYGICDKCVVDVGYIVGEFNGYETSLIEVVTICNTNNIITMYPVPSKYRNYNAAYTPLKKLTL